MNEELIERQIRSLDLYNRGAHMMSRGELDQAEQLLEQAREIFPDILLSTAGLPQSMKDGLQTLRGNILRKLELIAEMRDEDFHAAGPEPEAPAPVIEEPEPEAPAPVIEEPEPEAPAPVIEEPEPAIEEIESEPGPSPPADGEGETVSLDELLAEADAAFSESDEAPAAEPQPAADQKQPAPLPAPGPELAVEEPETGAETEASESSQVAIQGLLGEIAEPEPEPAPEPAEVGAAQAREPEPTDTAKPAPEFQADEEEADEEIDLEALGISADQKPTTEADALDDLDLDNDFDLDIDAEAADKKKSGPARKLGLPRIRLPRPGALSGRLKTMQTTVTKALGVGIALLLLAGGYHYFSKDIEAYRNLPKGFRLLARSDAFDQGLSLVEEGLEAARLSPGHKTGLTGFELSFTDSYETIRAETVRSLSLLGTRLCQTDGYEGVFTGAQMAALYSLTAAYADTATLDAPVAAAFDDDPDQPPLPQAVVRYKDEEFMILRKLIEAGRCGFDAPPAKPAPEPVEEPAPEPEPEPEPQPPADQGVRFRPELPENKEILPYDQRLEQTPGRTASAEPVPIQYRGGPVSDGREFVEALRSLDLPEGLKVNNAALSSERLVVYITWPGDAGPRFPTEEFAGLVGQIPITRKPAGLAIQNRVGNKIEWTLVGDYNVIEQWGAGVIDSAELIDNLVQQQLR